MRHDLGAEGACLASVSAGGSCDTCLKLDVGIHAVGTAVSFNLRDGEASRALQVGCASDACARVCDTLHIQGGNRRQEQAKDD